ncbi:Pyruvate/2-oxoglutarate/acetoin dehydrogenase complex, dehydrogenase (E1) component [Draconibacterium orientale]|uniref:3-methyl-2-oxobutanoate dehydrogenase (2-methylpropanoyl-transferring) n=1 Tax=Draconibacterium orientale TaxID=1168034 RepID=X5DCH3_9BACT|nr:alpha-ketoacid dehydrogenase subunit alpha/beta [Draconibacterium orientale]AHW60533.1 transketolase [Draconibacterium orientale]SET45071.1 Pyruvate/2-oxoglutarate/acetoin dehydrogenase complex, dehydrogenase (E1) component [Draconibacterium orientale]
MYLEKEKPVTKNQISAKEALQDYYIASLSRQLSIMGRREVHNGRAHFGIFGDGKEIAQIAYAKNFKKGDWRSGYYRDQTFMLALGLLEPEEFFAMIYGDTDDEINPSTGGRNFNNHFSTRNISDSGEIKDLADQYNSASDISSTAGQMPRLLGLAQASKMVREQPELQKQLNNNVTGNEVAFGSIGDASTSEGIFFETINAAGVLQVPLAIAVYDDGFGISVPIELQTTKSSISEALKGFAKEKGSNGVDIYKCKGWSYPELVKTFKEGIENCRKNQTPVVFHIDEVTQPQGHSTSGSHERYKTKERLEWEKEYDGINQMRKWLLDSGIADEDMLTEIEKSAQKRAKEARKKAWNNYTEGYQNERTELIKILKRIDKRSELQSLRRFEKVTDKIFPTRRSHLSFAKRLKLELHTMPELEDERDILKEWISRFEERTAGFYNGELYRTGADAALNVKEVAVEYDDNASEVNGSVVVNKNFDALFTKYPNLVTFGEDTGKLGDVNQGMKGMQEKYGKVRVDDAGIREATIIGQGIGLAMRGFRPIAEIQYLDYLIYAQSQLSDDLATLQYRTKGRQAAPLIVRTRGHQLQGIWHAGSPMQMLLGSMRGVYLCVPRNMTQAAGFYNTLLEGNDPALVIEPLKAYNVKEKLPANHGEYKVPLGVPEIMQEGTDVTVVTYAWNVHHAVKAAKLLQDFKGISIEVIDVQTLMPFDVNHIILESIKKTGKVIFMDEDVPGGGTAYMMQKVIEEQKAFDYLDTAPRTLSAQEHRPAYGIDGEYFSKPNVELLFRNVYEMMREVEPDRFPEL